MSDRIVAYIAAVTFKCGCHGAQALPSPATLPMVLAVKIDAKKVLCPDCEAKRLAHAAGGVH